jgi:hypothetical protein
MVSSSLKQSKPTMGKSNMQLHTHEKIGFVFLNGAGLESRIWNKVVEGFDHPYLLVESPHRKSSFELRKELSMVD